MGHGKERPRFNKLRPLDLNRPHLSLHKQVPRTTRRMDGGQEPGEQYTSAPRRLVEWIIGKLRC